MGKKARPETTFLAFGVGRASHHTCIVAAGKKVVFNREVANQLADIDRALAEDDPAAGVVVDQKYNIGVPAVARVRAAGTRLPTCRESR